MNEYYMFFKITRVLVISIVFLTQHPAQALYIVDGDGMDYKKSTQGLPKFPYVCKITQSAKIGEVEATGALISPRVVLTARHCVSINQKDILSPKDFFITRFKKGNPSKPLECTAKSIHTYKYDGKDTEDDLVLIILNEPQRDMVPVSMRAVRSPRDVNVTLMGFGDGGLISRNSVPPYDLRALNDSIKTFRYKSNISGSVLKSSLVPIEFPAKKMKKIPLSLIIPSAQISLGKGDSGGPVLDNQGNIIGINCIGRAYVAQMSRKEGESITKEIKKKEMQEDQGVGVRTGYRILRRERLKSNNDYLDHFEWVDKNKKRLIRIVKQKNLSEDEKKQKLIWVEIVAAQQCLVLNLDALTWINKIIAENPA